MLLLIVKEQSRPLPPLEEALIGRYTVTYPARGKAIAEEELIIRADNTYTQLFCPTNGEVISTSGTWEVQFDEIGEGLTLFQYHNYLDPFQTKVLDAPRILVNTTGVVRTSSTVKIIAHPEGLYFTKVE
jgi:hypothetical protein